MTNNPKLKKIEKILNKPKIKKIETYTVDNIEAPPDNSVDI
jgi:hypothetical protein